MMRLGGDSKELINGEFKLADFQGAARPEFDSAHSGRFKTINNRDSMGL
jgi:hypothetical protein